MRKHGCHNLPREAKPLLAQDGWIDMGLVYEHKTGEHKVGRIPRMVEVPFVNSIECRHDKRLTDPGCTDCKHAK